jgi:hypothetical protein
MRRYDHGPGDELSPAEMEEYARHRVADLRVRRIEGVWYAESDRLIAAGEGGTLLAAIESLLSHADERLW